MTNVGQNVIFSMGNWIVVVCYWWISCEWTCHQRKEEIPLYNGVILIKFYKDTFHSCIKIMACTGKSIQINTAILKKKTKATIKKKEN